MILFYFVKTDNSVGLKGIYCIRMLASDERPMKYSLVKNDYEEEEEEKLNPIGYKLPFSI